MRARTRLLSCVGVALALAACSPSTVAEAEKRGNVEWLERSGSADAIMALGRLADTNKPALTIIERRSSFDVNCFMAAWEGHLRGAAWATQLIRSGLVDPQRAEIAARALPRKEPKTALFIPEIEQAISRLSAGARPGQIAGVLASLGTPGHQAVERRLMDAKTRGPMCEGIGSPEASADAKALLMAVPVQARDHAACVTAVLQLAAQDDAVLGWLGTSGEPGLLSALGKGSMPCPRIVTTWKRALGSRPPETFPALTVPLSLSIKRCTPELDPLLAETLSSAPAARACVVNAIDPYGSETSELKAACKVLGQIAHSTREPHAIVERAENATLHSCAHVRHD